MTRLTKAVTVLLVSALVCLTVTGPVEAQNRWRRTRTAAPARNSESFSTRTQASLRTVNPYDPGRYGVPKYDGAFHERYYQEMLYPTGDRPIRGTAW
ncbi:MAG: hypothetical protein ACYC3X_09635 [Pirellulaceae bacterium]